MMNDNNFNETEFNSDFADFLIDILVNQEILADEFKRVPCDNLWELFDG